MTALSHAHTETTSARDSGPTRQPARVLMVTGTYPLVTTTFIDREFAGLRRLGIDVNILAVRRPAPGTPLSADQRMLAAETTYLLPARALTVLTAHLSALARHPVRFMRLLTLLLGARHPDLRARFKTVLHLGEGVVAAHLVRGCDFDEVMGHFLDRAATIALVVAGLADKPYILSVHAGADVFVQPVLLHEKLSGARRVVSCTAQNKRHIESIAGSDLADKIEVLPHGLDVTDYSAGPPPDPRRPVVLAVGQLKPRKGLAHLIKACHEVHRTVPGLRCRIVGEGPQRPELERMIAELGLDDVVQLLGAVAHDDVIAEYQRASMFVLPCVAAADGDVDGVPNVLAEAMASQLPVVSSDLPAVRELVTDDREGLLVPPGDDGALAAAMEELIDDPGRGDDLGARGRRRVVATFDADTNVRRLAQVLWANPVGRAGEGALR